MHSRRRTQILANHLSGGAESIRVLPITPAVGAEVFGIDLTDTSHETLATIDELFKQFKVLVFRGQDPEAFDTQQQLEFVRSIGRHWGVGDNKRSSQAELTETT